MGTWLKRIGGVVVVLLLLVAVVPFLIPVRPIEGLSTAEQLAGPASRFVTLPFAGTDGLDIHYVGEDPGAATEPIFVLLHGSLFNTSTWSEVLDLFGDRGRVIAYDQIPYGLSEKLVEGDWSAGNPYTSGAAVDQLVALLDALSIDEAVLVGSSCGGVLALQAALLYPERVQALVLADAAVYVEEGMPAWLLDLPQVRRIGPLFARQLGRSETFIRQTYANPKRLDDARLAQTLIHTQVEDWDLAFWEYLRVWGVGAPDVVGRLGEVRQPTLVLSGDRDRVVPVEGSRRLADALPNADLVVLPACGHVPQEECPSAFEAAVATWLARQEAAPDEGGAGSS